MEEEKKESKKRTEYFRNYMREYRKNKPEKIEEINERHWRNKLKMKYETEIADTPKE